MDPLALFWRDLELHTEKHGDSTNSFNASQACSYMVLSYKAVGLSFLPIGFLDRKSDRFISFSYLKFEL